MNFHRREAGDEPKKRPASISMSHFPFSTCCECGGSDPEPDGICEDCRPLYPRDEAPFVDDVCQCPACRSDMAGIVPGMREKPDEDH